MGAAMNEHAQSLPDAPPSETTRREAGAHILLFEDDDTLAALLARVLRAEGYSVDVLERATDVPSPGELASYSVVLSDVHLADDTNGHDVLRRGRPADPPFPPRPLTPAPRPQGAHEPP